MVVEIRQVFPEDLPGWIRTRRTTFLRPITVADSEVAHWATFLDPSRASGAIEDGQWVATLRTFPTMLSVPGGGALAADALTNVTVAGTHRRQGLLRRMLSTSLTEAKERGETLSILRAAEWPIYARFGYWPGSWNADYRVTCDRNAELRSVGEELTLRTVSVDDAVMLGSAVYTRMHQGVAGHISRERWQWDQHFGLNGVPRHYDREPVCVIAVDSAGSVDGMLAWTAGDQDFESEPVDVTIQDFIVASLPAYRALWSYLMHLDLVAGIIYRQRALDEALRWLLPDARKMVQTGTGDDLWLRILDVPAALSARRYGVQDSLHIEVIDHDAGGWAAGSYRLDGGPQHADCVRVSAGSADLSLSQRALSALYLGGNSVRSQQIAGMIEEHTTGAAARLSAMMHTDQQPWNATGF